MAKESIKEQKDKTKFPETPIKPMRIEEIITVTKAQAGLASDLSVEVSLVIAEVDPTDTEKRAAM
ncbi:uncharacterized protein N7484_007090 [Penicillium longicatenatum]|uniref:uncharacterized protein n=1 Tax=Penicillium longicatenatum TaxID=1561947 RepID=UPI00254977E0|nr:uncharacterized protein N7484_007090 [Penicillium longicatenatum]KAJ5639228.1 hypothetical protein N7484_007090 [Penicillium longicatenatum]